MPPEADRVEQSLIDIAVERKFDAVDYDYPGKRVHIEFFMSRVVSGEPRALGCSEFAWVDITGLDRYEFPPANVPVLKRLLSEYGDGQFGDRKSAIGNL